MDTEQRLKREQKLQKLKEAEINVSFWERQVRSHMRLADDATILLKKAKEVLENLL
ncbi:hypothetical protein ES703_84892 [subsurface metagenome]